jgi:hypothetical protein
VVQSVSNPEVYYLTGTLDALPTGPYKVVVLANWRYMPTLTKGSTTLDQLDQTGYFPVYKQYTPSASFPIPMYGIRTYDTVNNVTGHGLDFGNVTLTRALAKVVVASQDATLSDVTLVNFTTFAMGAPHGMYNYTSYSTSANLNYPGDYGAISLYTNWGNSYSFTNNSSCAFVEKEVSGWSKWYELYVAEHMNVGPRPSSSIYGTSNVTKNYITIKFQGQSYQIDFKEYESDYQDPFDILRNYRYVYYVEKNRITYSVVPYDSLTSEEILFK